MAFFFTTLLFSSFFYTFVHASPNDGSERTSSITKRAPNGGVGTGVSWVDMTSGDGASTGYDTDGIWYIKDAINLYLTRIPEAADRTGVFWAGGATTEDDFGDVDEFIEINLNSQAQKADMVYPYTDFTAMNLDGSNKNSLWWRSINRMSKGTSYLICSCLCRRIQG